MSKPLSFLGRTWSACEGLHRPQSHMVLCCCRSSATDVTDTSYTRNDAYESAKPFSKIPGPKGLPFVGTWLEYKLDPNKIDRMDVRIKKLQTEYGNIVKESFAGKTVLHLSHPDFIRQVYEVDGKYPTIPPLLDVVGTYRKDKDQAPGLGFSNGEDWYRLRRVVQQIMVRPQKALNYLPLQNEVGNDFINKLEQLRGKNGEVENFNQWVARWGLESAAKITFDMRMGYMEEKGLSAADKIIQCVSDVFDLQTKLFFSLPFYKAFQTPSMKRLYDCEDFVSSEAKRLLHMAVKEYEKALEDGELADDRFRFLSYMLGSENISDKDMLAVVKSVFNDTLSTTTQALLFNLYMLTTNPEAQDKAHEEAKEILSLSGDLSKEGFNSSTYIKACMKETFRFLPIQLDVQRLCGSDVVIGGYQVPKGTHVLLEAYVALNDAKFVADPDSFLPERWLRDSEEKVHPYLLIPFSIGTRMCAGRRFAEQELVMMLAKILVRYRVEWRREPLHMRYRKLQIPARDVNVAFIPR